MRIGIDGRLWSETGVGRYIRNLVKNLGQSDKKNQYVIFLRHKEFKGVELPGENWQKRLADIRWHTLGEQIAMPQILGREKLDLIHFPYFNVPILYRGPFVVTVHDLIINHFPTGKATTLPWPFYQLKRSGYQMALCHAVKNSRKIIAVSEATKQEIVDHFGINPGKVAVTYESGKLEVFKDHKPASPAGRSEIIDHKLKEPYLLYVGNAHPHKNLERLLAAFKKVKSASQNLKLVLVGKEDYFYNRLKNKVKEMGLSDAVVFYGEASDMELVGLYKNAVALILPSLMEGFGLPALEAMDQGCLVLASDIPAFHEICRDAAIYFDPHDINDIAAKIEKVIHSNDAYYPSKLIAKGLEQTKMFSWEKMAKETLKIYEETTR